MDKTVKELTESLDGIWESFDKHGASNAVNTRTALLQVLTTIEIARQLGRIADALEWQNQLRVLGPDPEL